MSDRILRLAIVLALAGGWLVLPTSAQQFAQIPTPEQFFGFPMGTDRRLAHWDDMVRYYDTIAERSDRVVVEELGTTTMGEPYLLVVISTPDTIRDLPRFKAMQRQLANPRQTSVEAAEVIAQTGKAVVLVGANVHATEIGTSQMMNDIVYQLAAEESPWVDNILENTIVLLIPSQNPDGQRMVVDWYRRNLGTPYEGSPLPELYHKYAGHDNNRDSYMLTQVETQHLNRVLYQDWLPEVYLDAHQMGSAFARIFVPPFKNPPNPNVDPLVWSQVNLFGQAMASKLHAADKAGVIWGELYSGYWQGANNTNPWWHNMVALLTEVASTNLASPVRQHRASDPRSVRSSAGTLGGRRDPVERDHLHRIGATRAGRARLLDLVGRREHDARRSHRHPVSDELPTTMAGRHVDPRRRGGLQHALHSRTVGECGKQPGHAEAQFLRDEPPNRRAIRRRRPLRVSRSTGPT